MKILFVLTQPFNPNQGGVQRTTYKLGKQFVEDGYRVSYYSFEVTGHIKSVYGTLYHSKVNGGQGNIENLKSLKNVIEQDRPDIVINQMPYELKLREALHNYKAKYKFKLIGCLRNSLFVLKNNLKWAVENQLPFPLNKFLNNALGRYLILQRHKFTHSKDLKSILNIHDKYVLLVPPNKDELSYFVGNYKQEKVTVIPNSIPKVLSSLPNKKKEILYVGRITITQKRSDLLISIWEKCCTELSDWEFTIVGDGPYLERLKKEVHERRVPRINIQGFQVPEPYYERASIYMMTSAFEGFPNTILEAKSYGCASLAFNSYPAIESIIQNRVDGILIPPYNTKSFADELISLASDSSGLHRMQQAALENAKQFEIETVVNHWYSLFEKLVNE